MMVGTKNEGGLKAVFKGTLARSTCFEARRPEPGRSQWKEGVHR